MIDLAEIQAAYYMVAATGVLVAAAFYVLNMRETTRNRRATLTNELLKNLYSEEGGLRWAELMSMEWKDLDDYYRKYDSTTNPTNYAKRFWLWNTLDVLGYQYRNGIIDRETVYTTCHLPIINVWLKFRPIIEEYRKFDYGKDGFKNWEYLANEMARLKALRDPSWKGSASYFKSGEFDEVFGKPQ